MSDRKWTKAAKGIETREHATRRHGLRFDKYYRIRFRRDNKEVVEGLGWQSEGWSLDRAILERARIVQAIKTGEGHQSLAEKREATKAAKEAETAAKALADAANRTFLDIFENEYLPLQHRNGKKAKTIENEMVLAKCWLTPAIGKKPLKDVSPMDLERVKSSLAKAKRSPRTTEYVFIVFDQVYKCALEAGFVAGPSPAAKVKLPKRDNRRLAFFSHEQADILLRELAKRSPDLHDQTLLSLHSGARMGEVLGLRWGDVNLAAGVISLLDTKNGMTRQAVMTSAVKAMFERRGPGNPSEYVFPGEDGGRMDRVSCTFRRTLKALGFNDDVDDTRQRLCFHSCRHSYASWMAMSGADLFTLKECLGHKDLKMTMRYSHLMPGHMKKAVEGLEAHMQAAREETAAKVVPLRRAKS